MVRGSHESQTNSFHKVAIIASEQARLLSGRLCLSQPFTMFSLNPTGLLQTLGYPQLPRGQFSGVDGYAWLAAL